MSKSEGFNPLQYSRLFHHVRSEPKQAPRPGKFEVRRCHDQDGPSSPRASLQSSGRACEARSEEFGLRKGACVSAESQFPCPSPLTSLSHPWQNVDLKTLICVKALALAFKGHKGRCDTPGLQSSPPFQDDKAKTSGCCSAPVFASGGFKTTLVDNGASPLARLICKKVRAPRADLFVLLAHHSLTHSPRPVTRSGVQGRTAPAEDHRAQGAHEPRLDLPPQ